MTVNSQNVFCRLRLDDDDDDDRQWIKSFIAFDQHEASQSSWRKEVLSLLARQLIIKTGMKISSKTLSSSPSSSRDSTNTRVRWKYSMIKLLNRNSWIFREDNAGDDDNDVDDSDWNFGRQIYFSAAGNWRESNEKLKKTGDWSKSQKHNFSFFKVLF